MSFRRIWGVFLRYFYTARRGLYQFTDLFYWPLIDILLWGLTSRWLESQNLQFASMPLILMTALIFWQICWRGSVDVAGSLLEEFWQRNLLNFFSTPLKFSEWILGMLLFSCCKLILTVSFGAIVVYILYTLNVFTIGWYFIPFMASLLIFGWSLSFLSSSIIIYWGHSVQMFAWITGGFFAPFSSVFYPVEMLPKWAQVISWSLPTTYIFEGMRSILRNQTFPLEFFWISLLLNLIYLVITITLFRTMFEKSRAKGLGRLE